MDDGTVRGRKAKVLLKPAKIRRQLPHVVRHLLIGAGGVLLAVLLYYVLKFLGV